MANSEGGRVVLGVREKDGKAVLDGLTAEAVARYQKILWDGMNDRTRVSINLMDSRHVQAIPIHDAFLLVVDIPRATRLQRPVYLGLHPFTESVNLRNRYLKPLLEGKKLVLKFPHQLNRPDQAYTAAPSP